MSFKTVTEFENKIAEFYGSPYAVSVDCCTHAIELCLRYLEVDSIEVPKQTYISIPLLSKKLNIDLKWKDEGSWDYPNGKENKITILLHPGVFESI